METPAPFDLNNAIHRWRENLATSPAFRAENLDELEAHLRDSVGALVAKGLSEEEAWWVAQRRTGSANLLNQEYSVINAEHVWLERLIWMVAGFVLIGWLSTVTGVLTDLSTAAALALDANIAVQDVPYEKLRERLHAEGQVLEYTPPPVAPKKAKSKGK